MVPPIAIDGKWKGLNMKMENHPFENHALLLALCVARGSEQASWLAPSLVAPSNCSLVSCASYGLFPQLARSALLPYFYWWCAQLATRLLLLLLLLLLLATATAYSAKQYENKREPQPFGLIMSRSRSRAHFRCMHSRTHELFLFWAYSVITNKFQFLVSLKHVWLLLKWTLWAFYVRSYVFGLCFAKQAKKGAKRKKAMAGSLLITAVITSKPHHICDNILVAFWFVHSFTVGVCKYWLDSYTVEPH